MTASWGCLNPTAARAESSLSDSVQIDLVARIPDRCAIKADGSLDREALNIETAQSQDLSFTLDCNSAFAIGVSARNGAMVRTGELKTDFAVSKPYTVALQVATNGGELAPPACSSESLKAGAASLCSFYGAGAGSGLLSGGDTAIGTPGKLRVSWAGPSGGPRLSAGSYQDVLTVTVGSRM
jgi:hypothetical protein